MTRLLLVLLVLAGCAVHRPLRHEALHAVPLPTSPLPTVVRPAVPQVSRTLARPPITPTRTSVPESVWDRLVACEAPGRGWRYGAPGVGVDPGYDYEGGPNFTRSTWLAFRLPGMPEHAYDANREQQIAVAMRVLAVQGVRAWPICGPRVGLTIGDAK